jgi:hypothetical protein
MPPLKPFFSAQRTNKRFFRAYFPGTVDYRLYLRCLPKLT